MGKFNFVYLSMITYVECQVLEKFLEGPKEIKHCTGSFFLLNISVKRSPLIVFHIEFLLLCFHKEI